MQSPGPNAYSSPGVQHSLYSQRSLEYDNSVVNNNSLGLAGNNYLAYQEIEEVNYNHNHSHSHSHSQSPHYNNNSHSYSHNSSSDPTHHQVYAASPASQNQYNQIYENGSLSHAYDVGQVNVPSGTNAAIHMRPQLKPYWNHSDSNTSNFTPPLPLPPLSSRPSPTSISPTMRSTNNNNNNYPPMQTNNSHSSPSPQSWTQHSPNVIPTQHSPRATPSPSSTQHNSRSPGLNIPPSHFSPPHDSLAQQHQTPSNVNYKQQNHSPSQANTGNPLESLQKMVMVDSPQTQASNGISSANVTKSPYYQQGANDQIGNVAASDPDSPYPTYYNLDQNRLCTPPCTNQVTTAATPFDNHNMNEESSLTNQIPKCNENNNANPESKILDPEFSNNESNKQDSKPYSQTHQPTEQQAFDQIQPTNDSKVTNSNVNNETVINRRTSRDSINSSDSDHHSPPKWHSNESKEYFVNESGSNNKSLWWQRHEANATHPKPPALPAQPSLQHPPCLSDNSMPPVNYPLPNCSPPTLVPSSTPNPHSYQTPSMIQTGGWSSAVESSGSISPNSMHYSHSQSKSDLKNSLDKKKRGRPFGSKNKSKRRQSEETEISEKSEKSEKSVKSASPIRKRKTSLTCDAAVNTSLSVNPLDSQQLTLAKPTQNTNKKKMIGPFVRIERKSDKTNYTLVNVANKPDDEKDSKGRLASHLQFTSDFHRQYRTNSMVEASKKKAVNTMSPSYDNKNKDTTWMCALCHKGSHYKGLGDLYGPYNCQIAIDEKTQTNPSINPSTNTSSYDDAINSVLGGDTSSPAKKSKNPLAKRRKSNSSDDGKKVKKASKATTSASASEPQTPIKCDAQLNEMRQKEVWIHEDCVVWSSGIYLIGHRVRNLEEIVKDSHETVCIKCKLTGATLGCLQKNCNARYHYLCAKEKDCDMNEENFSLHCPKHKKKTPKDSPSKSVKEDDQPEGSAII